jgi:CubicO group peptidase (beta-lactamase class C family)
VFAVVAIDFQTRFTRMSFRFHLLSATLLAAAFCVTQSYHARAFDLAVDAKLPPSQAVAVPAPPEQIDAAVTKLDELAAAIMKKSGIPGMSVAVVRGGKAVYAKGFGIRKAGEAAAVDADTVFQLASLSKPVGASVVAAQVGKGVVKWDDPVVKYLRWFALSDKAVGRMVTIGDLYAHRSGLPDHAGDDLEYLDYPREDVLKRLRYLPLAPFRASYAYTNFGLTAAAEAVAVASQIDWATLSDRALYLPLGMNRTSSRYADFINRDNHAVNHAKVDGGFQPRTQRDPDEQSPAGGVSSSANDMAKWMAMVLANGAHDGKPLIDKAALLPALSPQMISAPPTDVSERAGFYGYGMNVGVAPSGRVVLSHSGAFLLGAATCVTMIPSLDVGIVVLSNAAPIGAVETLCAEFSDLAQFGTITRDWYAGYAPRFAPMFKPFGSLVGKTPPSKPKAQAAAELYKGTYVNKYYGDAVVVRKEGKLLLLLGNEAGKVFPLRHWDGDTFVIDLDGEDAPAGSVSTVTFSRQRGKAKSLQIEYFASDLAKGVFRRE